MDDAEKLARAINALREIADAEASDFDFAKFSPEMVQGWEEIGTTPGTLAFRSLTLRAHVCLMAIDPSYAG